MGFANVKNSTKTWKKSVFITHLFCALFIRKHTLFYEITYLTKSKKGCEETKWYTIPLGTFFLSTPLEFRRSFTGHLRTTSCKQTSKKACENSRTIDPFHISGFSLAETNEKLNSVSQYIKAYLHFVPAWNSV